MAVEADLHLHSTCSDGRYPPSHVVNQCIEAGLSHFSLSDHDTLRHTSEVAKLLEELETPIRFIPAVEISCRFGSPSIHLLAYGITGEDSPVGEFVKEIEAERNRVLAAMGDRLKQLGYHVDYDSILARGGNVGRPHLAQALVDSGYFKTIQETFEILLGTGKPAYIQKESPQIQEAIDVVHMMGGVAAIAHPGVYEAFGSPEEFDGLEIDAIEVFHPDHDSEDSSRYGAYAEDRGLLKTGGSDYHGWPHLDKPPGSFGIGGYDLELFLERLYP